MWGLLVKKSLEFVGNLPQSAVVELNSQVPSLVICPKVGINCSEILAPGLTVLAASKKCTIIFSTQARTKLG